MKRQFRNKMNILNFKQEGINLLESVDIKVDGTRPWDIKILSDKTYSRVFRDGTLGFGEAYLNGEWECQSLDQLMEKIIRGNLHEKVNRNIKFLLYVFLAKFINYGRKDKAFEVGQHHYDIGNDFFAQMLASLPSEQFSASITTISYHRFYSTTSNVFGSIYPD